MPKLSTQLKVASGYILLTLLLFVSIGYIYREMRSLTGSTDYEVMLSERRKVTNRIVSQLYQAEIIGQSLSAGQLGQYSRYRACMIEADSAVNALSFLLTDSIQLTRLDTVEMLLLEKERNMRNLLYAIQEGGTDKLYRQHINELIAEQDSLLNQQRVLRKTITHSNSYVIHKKPKGFLKRIADVFAPGKGDSTQVSNIIQEEFTDTVTEVYNPADTVATLLKDIQSRVTDTHQQAVNAIGQRTQSLRINGLKLSQKVNQLLGTIEEEEQALAEYKYEQQENIRRNSAMTMTGIAIVAVLLATLFLIIIWRDITRSNHYRRELEKAKRRAEELLAAREKLMLTITHDIKAPVGSILGYIDLLSRLLTEGRQTFYLSNMQSSAKHLLSLVSSLLDYHRLDARKMDVNRVSFHPQQLFESIFVSFKPLASNKQLELNMECSKALDKLFIGDPFRIRQIVENLLSNALKFTQQGSITLYASLENGLLHFSVSDTGCGISAEEQEHIFQEFTRLKNAQGEEGFGLGLAITHKLVQLLEGEIKVESTQSKGSTFHIYLPLPAAPASTSRTQEPIAPLHILLIDDDRIQLQLTAAMLTRPNISTICCEHPDELFLKLKEETFDVLLTDIQMPAMNGFDLLKAVRNLSIPQTKTLPIIALTARSDMDEAYFRSKGFAGCLHKPFTINELFTVIRSFTPAPETLSNDQPELTPVLLEKNRKLNFSSLTAFSEDDSEAAIEIIRTFISETQKNRQQMKEAFEQKEMNGITAMAHKLLPLFTLLGAQQCIPALTRLEQLRGTTDITEEVTESTILILAETDKILQEAEEYLRMSI